MGNVNKGWNKGSWDGSRVRDREWGEIVRERGMRDEDRMSGSGGKESGEGLLCIGYVNNEGSEKGEEYEGYNL